MTQPNVQSEEMKSLSYPLYTFTICFYSHKMTQPNVQSEEMKSLSCPLYTFTICL